MFYSNAYSDACLDETTTDDEHNLPTEAIIKIPKKISDREFIVI